MKIKYYTDGACSSKDNCGGFAFVKVENDKEILSYSCGEKNTTNNRMEIKAIISALKSAILDAENNPFENIDIDIISDSQYCINSINKWLYNWVKNDFFRGVSNKNVKNIDLWEEFVSIKNKAELLDNLNISYIWVRGHDTNEFNNKADQLAVKARIDISKE